MSLTKLLKAPIKLFRKEVITFLIIRRYDLGILEEKLRYVAVKPNASVSVLRQKVWHLLDLPDFCEEIILLKSNNDTEIPLIELRKGNDPQHPYILEVWLPGKRMQSSSNVQHINMLTIGNGDERVSESQIGDPVLTDTIFEAKQQENGYTCFSQSTLSNETMAMNRLRVPENKRTASTLLSDFKKSDLSCRVSSTTIFKLNGRKSRDNFANILLKIQSDLCTLSTKLSVLENKLPSQK